MTTKRIHPRYAVSIAIVAVALLIPFSFTPDAGAVVNDACASAECCHEFGSICSRLEPDSYWTDECIATSSED